MLLDEPADAGWMQAVAAEVNLSETAFLWELPDGHGDGDGPGDGRVWSLRWFTPAIEVDLCGHATLASAHHLFHDHDVVNERATRLILGLGGGGLDPFVLQRSPALTNELQDQG